MKGEHRKIITIREAFPLDSGKELPSVELAYETYGHLNESCDNAILIAHALTGDAHVASHNPQDSPGWWEGLVGEGKPIDTKKFFVVASNVLGGCYGSTGPSSTNPDTGKVWGLDFPIITVGDMVRAQYLLCQKLGIKKLSAVVGGSLGGMQALAWAVTYPEYVSKVIPLATGLAATAQQIAQSELGRWAIMTDPAWRGGNYQGPGPQRGLGLARMIAMVSYKSPQLFQSRFGRGWQGEIKSRAELLGAGSGWDSWSGGFQVESYLHHQGQKLVQRFDANTYLYLTRAMDLYDLARGYGSLPQAVARIGGPVLVVGLSSDVLYLPKEQAQIAALCREARVETHFEIINSPAGHDGFLVELETIGKLVADFLH